VSHDIDAGLPTDRDAQPIQILAVQNTVNVSFTATPTNDQVLTPGAQAVMISATEPVWVQFGADGVTVTASQAGAILLPGGGVSLKLNPGDTHFAVVRAGSVNGEFSVARLA